ncbi:MAG: hypothetical protein KDA22_02140 [Phycisphaerales bacterium]|nr:hypothetical protein [Phycisphaerales bacterium]
MIRTQRWCVAKVELSVCLAGCAAAGQCTAERGVAPPSDIEFVITSDFGDQPWPAPDRTRSLYTIGYLSIAAGRNLAPMFRAAGAGKKPNDWSDRHPDIAFVEYTIADADVEALIESRRHAIEARTPADEREAIRAGPLGRD